MRIECRNIGYRYRAEDRPLFEGLSFSYEQPGFHALFGPSGAGKTTLARIICGAIKPIKGRIIPVGIGKILYTYNLERLPDWSTVGRHLEKVTPPGKLDLRHRLVAIFDVDRCLERRFGRLSLGQQNRVNLVRYLLQDFDLLIMDESLANVDEKTREKILLHLKKLFSSKMFIYITHNLVEVARFCRWIAVLGAADKDPRLSLVRGQDLQFEKALDSRSLQQTMLELMNAA